MMNKLSQILHSNAALIDRAMEQLLSGGDEQYQVLFEAMRYSAYAGGKRIRPTLTLEFCRMFGGEDRSALPFACAVEMIHTYSLIHDDLPCMDNDDMRRGKPTNHKVFGYANALLAGDALLTAAFGVAAGNGEVDADARLKAVLLLSEMAGADGMIGGQVLDEIGEEKQFDYDTLLKMNRLKTGCLIRAAAVLGCLAAGADREKQLAADRYASAVGLAFQIEDDILDDGEEDQKTTFLSFLNRGEAHALAQKLTEEACLAIAPYPNSDTLTALARYLVDRKV